MKFGLSPSRRKEILESDAGSAPIHTANKTLLQAFDDPDAKVYLIRLQLIMHKESSLDRVIRNV